MTGSSVRKHLISGFLHRYRLIVQPFKSRVQASLCIIAVWVGSLCVVLPYAIYIKYTDLEPQLGKPFEGVGICTVHSERRIEEYIRAMFVTLFAMPLATMALLYVRISAEMKSKENAASRPLSVHFSPISTSTEVDLDRSSMLHHHQHRSGNSSVASTSLSWSPVHEQQPSPPARSHRHELVIQYNGNGDNAQGQSSNSSSTRNQHSGIGSAGLGSHHLSLNESSSSGNFLSAPNTGSSSLTSSPKVSSFSRGHHSHGHHHHHRGSASTTSSGGERHSTLYSSPGETGTHGASLTLARGGDGLERGERRKCLSYAATVTNGSERSNQGSEDDLDLPRERRTQNYLIIMTTLFAMCWCPSHILILVHYFVRENDDNMHHYDITYMLCIWFGFLSVCTTPVLFMSWVMSDAAKDRLRGYFRFSNRRRTSAGSQVILPLEVYKTT
ncbi:neuropeptide y receptor type 2-like [Plakobranchus ocellatus]|uniref:Neuropeptide y receptor type 2-like n=1 Tax=Plakobranchus ocellatus TaxID=259542 RepID=A0AAV4C080_9GAST|nr:neuropeptide y receptor type 2-like [Plakobranchus ocellatus]